ncbi:cupin domain-containing protein [Pedobacter frigidisoli]|uniref:Cupin domain-containing protein n=1 Tax=Pedobacter frigidisoli TaxID=2530455 RepID=A0A4R0NQ87_9SPHI|nr:cupin domain-containing protein [Pedobacter frigidisoli]TCD02188.1 cupin domain-containing protein [Pedobacter frigidisoli]
MKRNSFFKAIGLLVTMPFISLKGFSAEIIQLIAKMGFLVRAGRDRFEKPITLFEGDTFYTKVSTKDTNGDLYVFESTRIKNGGPSLHFHYDQDEIWYILEGEFLIKVGDITYEAKAGDTVFGPRKIPHSFAKRGDGQARVMITFQPAGKMEEFFIKVSQGKLKELSPEQQQAVRKEHGFEAVGAGVGYMKKL